jgi:hypothetical protein
MLQSLKGPRAETAYSYLLIAATLLTLLALGVFAIWSGAIDDLNASGLLGNRS